MASQADDDKVNNDASPDQSVPLSSAGDPDGGKSDKVELKREINLPYAASIMTGIIIGSGIFVSPTSIIENCGSVALSIIMWLVCGVITLGIVMCYAELGGVYPKAGGDYAFFKEVLGPFTAFLNVWVQFLTVKPVFYAICAITTANYILKPFFPDCDIPVYGVKLLSLWILVSLAVLNTVGVRHVARFQFIFMVTKLVALFIIIVAGMTQLARGQTEYLASGFEGTSRNLGDLSTALVSGLFTYGGWNYIFNLLEEVKEPQKVVPQASVISMVTVILLYCLTNVSYFTVMSPGEMAASSTVALTFANRALGRFAVVIPVFVAMSAAGALNGAILGGSRKYFAAARDGLFPDVLATIQTKYSTPAPSIWATCTLSCVFIISGNAIQLIEYLGFVDTFIYGLAMYCVIHLKVYQPNIHRPICVPMFVPVVSLLMMILAFVLGLYKDPFGNGIGALIILSGVPAYGIGVLWKPKPQAYRNCVRKMTIFVQKVGIVLLEDDSSDKNQ